MALWRSRIDRQRTEPRYRRRSRQAALRRRHRGGRRTAALCLPHNSAACSKATSPLSSSRPWKMTRPAATAPSASSPPISRTISPAARFWRARRPPSIAPAPSSAGAGCPYRSPLHSCSDPAPPPFLSCTRRASLRAEARKAQKVNQFLNDILSSASKHSFDPQSSTVAQMLESAEPMLEKSWLDDPLTGAKLHQSLGLSYMAIQRIDRAKPHLQKALAAFQASGDDLEIASTLRLIGEAAADEGRHEVAVSFLEQSLDRLRSSGKAAPPRLVVEVKIQLAGLWSAYLETESPRGAPVASRSHRCGK